MAAGSLAIEVQRPGAGADAPSDADLRRWVRFAFGDEARGEVTLRIVDEDESAELNHAYRGKAGPTNVLSFPAGDFPGADADGSRPLGDLVVCAAVVAREALEQHKSAAEHWAHIVIHGSLHLLGYDHVSDAEADVMERCERELLAELGIADPYRIRAG